ARRLSRCAVHWTLEWYGRDAKLGTRETNEVEVDVRLEQRLFRGDELNVFIVARTSRDHRDTALCGEVARVNGVPLLLVLFNFLGRHSAQNHDARRLVARRVIFLDKFIGINPRHRIGRDFFDGRLSPLVARTWVTHCVNQIAYGQLTLRDAFGAAAAAANHLLVGNGILHDAITRVWLRCLRSPTTIINHTIDRVAADDLQVADFAPWVWTPIGEAFTDNLDAECVQNVGVFQCLFDPLKPRADAIRRPPEIGKLCDYGVAGRGFLSLVLGHALGWFKLDRPRHRGNKVFLGVDDDTQDIPLVCDALQDEKLPVAGDVVKVLCHPKVALADFVVRWTHGWERRHCGKVTRQVIQRTCVGV